MSFLTHLTATPSPGGVPPAWVATLLGCVRKGVLFAVLMPSIFWPGPTGYATG